VKTMLETALGSDKAIVRVSCSLDFKKLEKTEERYDPENKVVRSEQTLNENSSSGTPVALGVPGVASNLAEGNAVENSAATKKEGNAVGSSAATKKEGNAVGNSATTSNNPGYQKEDKTVNYEISKVTSHVIEPIGKVDKISVAVLVDGTYKKIENENGEEELKYFSRSSEEIEKLKNVVKRAVNFDSTRGDEVEVLNIPFEGANLSKENAANEEGKRNIWSSVVNYSRSLIKYGFVAAFLILFFIFIARPLVQWLTSGQNMGPEILTQLPKTVEELEREYLGGTKGPTNRDRALDVIKRDKELSLQLMKDWLKKT
jgi:flagellar M-ring protein FliF